MKSRPIKGITNKNIFELVDETPRVYASFDTPTRYGKITLEQWGSDIKKLVWHLYVYDFELPFEFSQTWDADNSKGWETLKETYKHAVWQYNIYAPETIPAF